MYSFVICPVNVVKCNFFQFYIPKTVDVLELTFSEEELKQETSLYGKE